MPRPTFAHLPDGLQASREQRVLYPRWELDFADRRVVRKLWLWLKLTHFFAFSLDLDLKRMLQSASEAFSISPTT